MTKLKTLMISQICRTEATRRLVMKAEVPGFQQRVQQNNNGNDMGPTVGSYWPDDFCLRSKFSSYWMARRAPAQNAAVMWWKQEMWVRGDDDSESGVCKDADSFHGP